MIVAAAFTNRSCSRSSCANAFTTRTPGITLASSANTRERRRHGQCYSLCVRFMNRALIMHDNGAGSSARTPAAGSAEHHHRDDDQVSGY